MLDAIAYLLTKQRLIWDAVRILGHERADESAPRRLDEHLARLKDGDEDATLGTSDDPFVIEVDDTLIAMYFIETVDGRPNIQVSGSAAFLAAYDFVTQSDEPPQLH